MESIENISMTGRDRILLKFKYLSCIFISLPK